MYFFDIIDYYTLPSPSNWADTGMGGTAVGCAGAPMPNDWDEYFTTAYSAADAFLKVFNEWWLASKATGQETYPNMDDGCTPNYDDLLNTNNTLIVEYRVRFAELTKTLMLHDYYYEWLYSIRDSQPIWNKTYEEYKYYLVNNLMANTGSTSTTIAVSSPSGGTQYIPVTINYGTSFTKADLQTKVTNYENAIKALMCGIKNMLSVMDGDTFDEYVYDSNGNYNTNKIGII